MSPGPQPLVDRYDGIVCDLDGVVYRGRAAVPHAVEVLSGLAQPVVYATNNASRTPGEVADHLRELGLELEDRDVITSSTASASMLARELPVGAAVLAVGGPGVSEALRSVGLEAVPPSSAAGREVSAVLQGYGSDVGAGDLAEAAYAIQAGARWVATNLDLTLPTERGMAPGNGSLVAAVRAAVDIDPEAIGKPASPMYTIAAEVLAVPVGRVLAVGDRLDTDLGGAVAAGTAGVLVLTGVHGWADAAAAPLPTRPDYVVEDLRGLLLPYPDEEVVDGWCVRGDAAARFDGELRLRGDGADLRRAALDALWRAQGEGVDPQWCRDAMDGVVGAAR